MDKREARQSALALLEERSVVLINGRIEEENGDIILECLITAFHKGFEHLTLVINSGGGMASTGIAIYNFLQICVASGMHIRGIVISRCSSAASVLFQACSSREVMAGASMVIHWGRSSLSNQEQDAIMTGDADWVLRQFRLDNEEMLKVLESKSKIERSVLMALCRNEELLSAARIVELGLADKVVDATSLSLPKHMLISS